MGALLLAAAAASIAATVPPAAAPPASGGRRSPAPRPESRPGRAAAAPEAAASAPARPLLLTPVEGVAAAALRDSFGDAAATPAGATRRSTSPRRAAPRCSPSTTAAVVKLFTSVPAG